MRVLWVGNYETQSGYSIQSRLFVRELMRLGHRVDVLSIGSNGMPRQIDGVQVIPTAKDMLGHDLVVGLAERMRADAVFTLTDTWALNPAVYGTLNWYPFTPIDHTPTPPAVVNAVKAAKTPIAFSQFGVQQLQHAGVNPYYVPHAVDPAVWQPVPMAEARRRCGVPADAFWVSFVGVNDSVPSRKSLFETLAAWQMFSREHLDAVLYLHTSETGNLHASQVGGVNLPQIIKTLEINPKQIRIVDQFQYTTGMPQSYLALMYASSDAFILCSKGEGFGLPVLEAERCGCPVIVTDFAASAELCASGWKVSYVPSWSWQNALYAQPDIGSIYDRLCEAYEHRGDLRKRVEAVTFAREYDINTVSARYFAPVVNAIAERGLLEQKIA